MKACIVICVAAMAALAWAGCENNYRIEPQGAPGKMERTLTVTGIAKLEVRPDEASVDFTFSSTDKKIARAHELTKQKVDAFVKVLKDMGVSPDDIVFGYTSYSPDYVYDQNKPARIVSFTASTSLTVKTKDFKQVPAIVEAGASSNITNLGSIQFYSTKLPEHKKQVRDMALKAARDKAKQIAKGLDIKLGKAISVYEGGFSSSAYRGWGPYSQYGWGGNVANVAQQVSQAGSQQELFGPISAGTTPLEMNIDCVFEIL